MSAYDLAMRPLEETAFDLAPLIMEYVQDWIQNHDGKDADGQPIVYIPEAQQA